LELNRAFAKLKNCGFHVLQTMQQLLAVLMLSLTGVPHQSHKHHHHHQHHHNTKSNQTHLTGLQLPATNVVATLLDGDWGSLDENLGMHESKRLVTWRKVPTNGYSPSPRTAHASTVIDDSRFYLFGGKTFQNQYLNDLFVLDLNEMQWKFILPQPIRNSLKNSPCPRVAHSFDAVGSNIVLFGGLSDHNKFLNDLHILTTNATCIDAIANVSSCSKVIKNPRRCIDERFADLKTGCCVCGGGWTHQWIRLQVSGSPPSRRQGHATAVIDNSVYLMGGNAGTHSMNDLFSLTIIPVSAQTESEFPNLLQVQWRELRSSGDRPSPKEATRALALGVRILLHGGGTFQKPIPELHWLDTTLLVWSVASTRSSSPPALEAHAMVRVLDDTVAIFGGYDGTVSVSSTFLLQLSDMTWSRPASNGSSPFARCDHTAFAIRGRMYIFGGGDFGDRRGQSSFDAALFNDLHEMQIERDGTSITS
jgi:hypothetical protein